MSRLDPSSITTRIANWFLVVCTTTFAMSVPATAEEVSVSTVTGNISPQATATVPLAAIDQWQVSVALGFGQRTSAVYQQQAIPLYVIPSVRYYRANAFFDNGTLGYTFIEQPQWAFSVITEFNPLAAQFYDYHPENIFSNNAISGDVVAPEPTVEGTDNGDFADQDASIQPPTPEIRDINLKRPRWSLDIGLQHNWFISPKQSVILQAMTDASNLHSGSRLELLWTLHRTIDSIFKSESNSPLPWRFTLQLGVQWLDTKSAQYYYGIDERHLTDTSLRFNAKAALNPTIAVTLNKPLTTDWHLILFYKQQALSSQLADSPKLTDSKIHTYFAGVRYEF